MNHLLSTLTAEGSDESAQEFYYSCLHDSRTMEDGGLRLEPPPVPKGWKRAKCNESARQLRRRIVGLRAHSDTEIADYYVKKLQEIFQAVINAFGQRFTIPPVLSTMEDYLGSDCSEKEVSPGSALPESIEAIVMHCSLGKQMTLQRDSLIAQMRQLRFYEKSQGTNRANSAEAIGVVLAGSETLSVLFQPENKLYTVLRIRITRQLIYFRQ